MKSTPLTDVYESCCVQITTPNGVQFFAGSGTGLPLFFQTEHAASTHLSAVRRVNPDYRVKLVKVGVTVMEKGDVLERKKEGK